MDARGLSRKDAARYIGVSPATFDCLVREGAMPKPVALPIRKKIWDRTALDYAFNLLSCIKPEGFFVLGGG